MIGDVRIGEGDWLSIDANTGRVYIGQSPIQVKTFEKEAAQIEKWRRENSVADPAAEIVTA